MAKTDPVLNRLRKICLALPDTEETITWGHPHFRVAGKIFCGYGEHKGRVSVTFKLDKGHAELIEESYRLIAPKRILAQLDGRPHRRRSRDR